MKRVTLANTQQDTKEVNINFSVGYFFLGPIYHLCKGMIVRGILLTLVYLLVIGLGFFPLYKEALANNLDSSVMKFLDDASNFYWWLVGVLIVVHVLLALLTPRMIVIKLLKLGYVPYCEIDTQILIKRNLVKVGTLCYLSSFKAIDGVQGKIKMGNSKNLAKELEELKELLKDGMISKDEYEEKRAMAIMRSGNNKK